MGDKVGCKGCGDSGWLFNLELGQAIRCGCFPLQSAAILSSSGIPERFSGAELTSMTPQSDVERVSLEEIGKLCSFSDGFLFKTLLIAGPPGVGKTHVLCSFVEAAARAEIKAKYWDFPNLCRTIRDRFMHGPTTIVSEMCKCSVLAVDNVGFGRGSEFERSVINEIVCARYDLGLSSIYSTNYMPYSNSSPTGLGSRVGEHVLSRLLSEGVYILDGPDRRRVGN